jgi:hypothetical protein
MSFWTPVENPGTRPPRSWVFDIGCALLAAAASFLTFSSAQTAHPPHPPLAASLVVAVLTALSLSLRRIWPGPVFGVMVLVAAVLAQWPVRGELFPVALAIALYTVLAARFAGRDPAAGYNTWASYAEEDAAQALDQFLNTQLGRNTRGEPAARWPAADDGMHVLALLLYDAIRRGGFDPAAGSYADFLARALSDADTWPGDLEALSRTDGDPPLLGLLRPARRHNEPDSGARHAALPPWQVKMPGWTFSWSRRRHSGQRARRR